MAENTRKQVEYVPPPQAVIDQAAQSVCQKVAEDNPTFEPAKSVHGLAAFLSVLARMHASHLNRRRESADSLDSGGQSE